MNMAADLTAKVFTFTEENALFSAPCHLLVGVSGGADSMVLLHLLAHWPVEGVRVSAVHVHHGLRGEAADRDERFVRDYCRENGIGLAVYHEDVSAFAESEGLTLEEAGRQVRYANFESCRQAVGADYILTAHTASDQVETALMRIIRGTGVDGLAGIPAVRGAIRRPLLCCSRDEVEAYCREHCLAFVTDETNADAQYTRNRIRHEVLPLLRRINPAVDEAVLRLVHHASADAAYFRDLADEACSQTDMPSLSAMREWAAPVRRRVICRLLRHAGVCTYEQRHLSAVDSVIMQGCGSVRLPGGISAVASADTLRFEKNGEQAAEWEPVPVEALPCSVTVCGRVYTLSVVEAPSKCKNVHNLFSTHALDYDKIQGNLCVRSRQEGDAIHPAGRGVGKSLKKLMNEYRIPVWERVGFPLVCDEQGVVLMPGYTCDERVRISADTKHFLVWNEDTEQG